MGCTTSASASKQLTPLLQRSGRSWIGNIGRLTGCLLDPSQSAILPSARLTERVTVHRPSGYGADVETVVERVRGTWRIPNRRDPSPRWITRAADLATDADPYRAIQRFEQLQSEMAYLDRVTREAAIALGDMDSGRDRSSERKIDRPLVRGLLPPLWELEAFHETKNLACVWCACGRPAYCRACFRSSPHRGRQATGGAKSIMA